MSTLTPILQLQKPNVGGEETKNLWGYSLNGNFDKIDAWTGPLPGQVQALSDAVAAKPAEAPADGQSYLRRGSTQSWVAQPLTYPPAPHQHPWTEITSKPTTFPPTHHGHVIDDVVGLEEELESKLDAEVFEGHVHTVAEVTDFPEAVDDRVGGLLKQGPGISLSYDDTLGALTINAVGGPGGGLPGGVSGQLQVNSAGAFGGSNLSQQTDGRLLTATPLIQTLGTSLTPTVNGRMTIQATNNTTLTLKYRGSDGAVRKVDLPLVALALVAPVLTWDTPASDLTPNFTATVVDAFPGDVLLLEVSTQADFSVLYGTESHTLNDAEAAAGTYTFTGIAALADGVTYYARVKITR